MAGRAPRRAIVAGPIGRTLIFVLNRAASDEADDIRDDVTRARELQAEDHSEDARKSSQADPNLEATVPRAASAEHDGGKTRPGPCAAQPDEWWEGHA